MTKNRELVGDLIDSVEALLDSKGITIPSADRTGEKSEARLFGMEHAFLLDGFEQILNDIYPEGAIDESGTEPEVAPVPAKEPLQTNNREIAGDMLDILEELLDDKDITVPSLDREGDETEARLYGREFWNLLDLFEDTLDVAYPHGAVDEDYPESSGGMEM